MNLIIGKRRYGGQVAINPDEISWIEECEENVNIDEPRLIIHLKNGERIELAEKLISIEECLRRMR